MVHPKGEQSLALISSEFPSFEPLLPLLLPAQLLFRGSNFYFLYALVFLAFRDLTRIRPDRLTLGRMAADVLLARLTKPRAEVGVARVRGEATPFLLHVREGQRPA